MYVGDKFPHDTPRGNVHETRIYSEEVMRSSISPSLGTHNGSPRSLAKKTTAITPWILLKFASKWRLLLHRVVSYGMTENHFSPPSRSLPFVAKVPCIFLPGSVPLWSTEHWCCAVQFHCARCVYVTISCVPLVWYHKLWSLGYGCCVQTSYVLFLLFWLCGLIVQYMCRWSCSSTYI